MTTKLFPHNHWSMNQQISRLIPQALKASLISFWLKIGSRSGGKSSLLKKSSGLENDEKSDSGPYPASRIVMKSCG